MRNLTVEHVWAIVRAEHALYPSLVPNMPARHREQIENDLERLAEVKKYILSLIYAPNLPIVPNTPKGL